MRYRSGDNYIILNFLICGECLRIDRHQFVRSTRIFSSLNFSVLLSNL